MVALSREYKREKNHSTIDLQFDWFGISCKTTDDFCFHFQNRLIQTSQTGGQCTVILPPLVFPVQTDTHTHPSMYKRVKFLSSFQYFSSHYIHFAHLVLEG